MPSFPTEIAAVAVALWLVVAPAWAPLLYADRVRALFADWPTGSLLANYAAVSFLFAVAHVLTFFGVVAARGRLGGVALVQWAVVVAVAFPLAGWILASVGLPHTGRWDPAGGGVDGRVVLGVGAAWYALVAGVAVGFVFLVAMFWFFPG